MSNVSYVETSNFVIAITIPVNDMRPFAYGRETFRINSSNQDGEQNSSVAIGMDLQILRITTIDMHYKWFLYRNRLQMILQYELLTALICICTVNNFAIEINITKSQSI